MIKFNRKNKKLTIPVGINPNYGNDSSTFYDTSNANITPDDVVKGKIGYGKSEEVIGTLDVDAEKEISYQDGYETGKVDGYDSGYSIGYSSGVNDQKAKLTSITITENGSYSREDGYNEINVDVHEKVSVGEYKIKFGFNLNLIEVPDIFEFTNMIGADCCRGLFYACQSLKNISYFDTSQVTAMNNMMDSCYQLTEIPFFNTSNVISMRQMLYSCIRLTSVPQFDLSRCQSVDNMLHNCSRLTSVPEFDLSSMRGTESNATRIFGTTDYVINFGGLKNLGKSYSGSAASYKDLQLQNQSKLTHESCMNVINKVYDMNLNSANTYTPKIRFHATAYATLSADDIAIATNKGWAVQAG